MSLSDLASLSKVMELPDGSVEYVCTFFWHESFLIIFLKDFAKSLNAELSVLLLKFSGIHFIEPLCSAFFKFNRNYPYLDGNFSYTLKIIKILSFCLY